MTTRTNSVLILCGGRGKRLESRTNQTPKVLVPVNGKPIVNYILDHFESQGFGNFVFGTGYLSDQVERFLAHHRSEMNHVISNAGESASMLQRLYAAREHFGDYTIVSYGDTFIDINYQELLETHKQSGDLATLVTGQIQNPFGVVSIDDQSKVTSFVEKPVYDHYIGCFVFSKTLLTMITPELLSKPDGAGLVDVFSQLASMKKLRAFRHRGLQVTFNTEQELQQANSTLKNYYTVRES